MCIRDSSSALELSILSHPFVHHWQLNTPSLLQTHPTLCASPFYTLAGKPVTLQFEINEPFVNIILLAQDGKKLQWKAGERERIFKGRGLLCTICKCKNNLTSEHNISQGPNLPEIEHYHNSHSITISIIKSMTVWLTSNNYEHHILFGWLTLYTCMLDTWKKPVVNYIH